MLLSTLAVVLGFNLVDLAGMKVLALYIDSVAGNPLLLFDRFSLNVLAVPATRIYAFPLVLVTIAGVRWLFVYRRSVLQARLGQGAMYDLRQRIYQTMQSLSFAYHDRVHSGTLISNIVEDVGQISRFFQMGLFPLLEMSSYLIIAYAAMFYICWPAALASLSLLTLWLAGIYLYFRFGYKYFARTRRRFNQTVANFTENMEGHLVVRAFGRQQSQIRNYSRKVDSLHDAKLREILMFSALNQLGLAAGYLGIPAVLAVALHRFQSGSPGLASGTLFFLFTLQYFLTGKLRVLSRILTNGMRFCVAAERLGELFDADDYLDDSGTRRLPRPGPGALEMRAVSFSYNRRSPVLREVSLAVQAGQIVGLAGPSGSGKSTLALLLCRFYDAQAGSILIDGKDIREYSVNEVRRQFALVFQEVFLFSASVRDNIAYGKPGAGLEEVVHAATLAQSHDFIMRMPDGYDTVIGERGVTLSGGQRQRLALARAILCQPRFLILDDCTSALDSKTEEAIHQALDALRGDTTIIIIAHRFTSLEYTDRVYVLEDGALVESGTPRELNAPGTALSRILQTQREAG